VAEVLAHSGSVLVVMAFLTVAVFLTLVLVTRNPYHALAQ